MSTLSIVMIVKNEAECLAACLDSVRGIADEIVIGDTGSSDDTVSIARGYEAKIVQVPWRDDFAEARNAVLQAATGDWLLHLDADEVLDPEGAAKIHRIVAADGGGADAIEVLLANYCDDPRAWRWKAAPPDSPYRKTHSGYIEVPLLRLFRNHAGYAYREAVHENITQSVFERGGRVRRENILIHHYGYAGTAEKSAAKARFYLGIARHKLARDPESVKALHDFAEQALACGLTAEAETACRKALERDAAHLESASTLANILLNRGDTAAAQDLLAPLAGDNAPPHLHTALGAIHYHHGEFDAARQRLRRALKQDPHAIMARLYLARVLECLGKPEGAWKELARAQASAPDLDELRDRIRAHDLRQHAALEVDAGKLEVALARLAEALKLDPYDPLLYNDLGVVLYMMGDAERARCRFEECLQLCPGLAAAKENLAMLGP